MWFVLCVGKTATNIHHLLTDKGKNYSLYAHFSQEWEALFQKSTRKLPVWTKAKKRSRGEQTYEERDCSKNLSAIG